MKKLLIGVDIDSVVNDLSAAVLEVYNEDSGDNLTISDITDYMIEKFIDDSIKNLNGTHDYISVCIDMPYNQGFNNCLRFKTVQDFVDLFFLEKTL